MLYLATKKFNQKPFCLTSNHLQRPFKHAEGPTKYRFQQEALNRGLNMMSSGDTWSMFSQPRAQDWKLRCEILPQSEWRRTRSELGSQSRHQTAAPGRPGLQAKRVVTDGYGCFSAGREEEKHNWKSQSTSRVQEWRKSLEVFFLFFFFRYDPTSPATGSSNLWLGLFSI